MTEEIENQVGTEEEETQEVEEEETETQEEESEEDDEVIVTIGEESSTSEEEEPEAKAEWLKELRKNYREAQRELKQLKEKANTETNHVPQLGKKPTLEDADYDSEVYETELAAWFERKQKHDEAEAKQKQEQEAQARDWQGRLDSYAKAKESLSVRDYDEAEFVIQENLSQVQQGLILQGAENPALVVYALGNNKAKVKELAGIKDPVKFAVAIGKIEAKMKVTSKKTPPSPEKTISGNANLSGTVDSTLERLRKEADRTGDYSKVHEYNRQKRK